MTRPVHVLAALHALRWRKPLAMALAAATLLISLPSPMAASAADALRGENPYLFRNGGQVYHLDLTRLEGLWSVVARRAGAASITLQRLRDAPVSIVTPGPLFFLDEDDPLDAVAPLGSAEHAELVSPGGSLVDPRAWEEVVTWSVSATAADLTTTLTAGRDQVTSRFPWALADPRPALEPGGEPIEIEVNGTAVILGPDLLIRLQQSAEAGEPIRDDELPLELHLLAGRFDDLPGFMNRVHGLYLADARVRGSAEAHDLAGAGVVRGCTAICIGCIATVVLSIGAYLALIASCGGALVTGGATAIACIAAFVGVQGSHFAALGACGRCYDCAQGPEE